MVTSTCHQAETVTVKVGVAESAVSCRVAPFEFFNPALGLVFRVVHRLADLFTVLGGVVGIGFLVRFMDLLRGVLDITPGFLRRTFGLID